MRRELAAEAVAKINEPALEEQREHQLMKFSRLPRGRHGDRGHGASPRARGPPPLFGDSEVADVVGFGEGGPLTPALVRECCGSADAG